MSYYSNFREVKKQSSGQPIGVEVLSVSGDDVTFRCILRRVFSIGLHARFRKAVAFALRQLAYPRLFMHWYSFLARFSAQYRLTLPHDDLIRKAVPNFFLHKATSKERLYWLQNHFAIAGRAMATEDLQSLWQGKRLRIAIIEGKQDYYDLSLCLSDHAGARHEGVFTISLSRRRDQAFLHMLSFIFTTDEKGNVTIAIGGFQGAKSEYAKRYVIDTTRDLFGLRPKDALLLVAEGMAETGGADHMMAVTNDTHVINFRHAARREKLKSDLNSYWTERGGKAGGRFGFILPLRNSRVSEKTTKRELCKSAFLFAGQQLMSVQGNEKR